MKSLKVLALESLLIICFLAFGFAWGQERSTLVNISIPSLSFDQAPYVFAKEKGYFRQEGTEPRFILMHSAIASKALITKDVDFNPCGICNSQRGGRVKRWTCAFFPMRRP